MSSADVQMWPHNCSTAAAASAAAAVVLLLLALREWRASLGPDTPPNRLPANAAERGAFKQLLQGMRRTQGEDSLPLDVRLVQRYTLWPTVYACLICMMCECFSCCWVFAVKGRTACH
jgi:hypothetical protein